MTEYAKEYGAWDRTKNNKTRSWTPQKGYSTHPNSCSPEESIRVDQPNGLFLKSEWVVTMTEEDKMDAPKICERRNSQVRYEPRDASKV